MARCWLLVATGAMCHLMALAGDLVGPGALRPYDGGPPAPRKRGTVREPAAGFFIAGSSIEDMNGVYTRVHTVRTTRRGDGATSLLRSWAPATVLLSIALQA